MWLAGDNEGGFLSPLQACDPRSTCFSLFNFCYSQELEAGYVL